MVHTGHEPLKCTLRNPALFGNNNIYSRWRSAQILIEERSSSCQLVTLPVSYSVPDCISVYLEHERCGVRVGTLFKTDSAASIDLPSPIPSSF